jgi:outer membrane immunogenic protein
MKTISLLLAGTSLLALMGTAQAADLLISEPADLPVVVDAAHDWSGFYAGAHVGYGAGTLTIPDFDFEEDVDGYFGGVQLGYNVQLDNIVLGVQTDISLADISNPDETPGDSIDWFGSTTIRAGVAVDSFLPYLKAGVAYGAGTGTNDSITDTQTFVGWTAGIGAEVAVTDDISLFAEYDYYDFGTATFDFGDDVDVGATLSVVKVGLNFAF